MRDRTPLAVYVVLTTGKFLAIRYICSSLVQSRLRGEFGNRLTIREGERKAEDHPTVQSLIESREE